ncbi:adenylate/guanylate cyclase domain-containing protein [Actinocrispum sp. NPDC049592]|uniref:adenylate/guanylate cyclase domain-containing protein n=1 Tax=Actinocrispum sp. NPDC049592 TaxID=3154835 RepID=UPI003423BA06
MTLTDARSIKKSGGEVNWLPTMGWFFDQVGDAVREHGGTVNKYLNDGVVATFPMDKAAEAINSAILIQERISEAHRDNTYRCNCAIGIATGRVVEFTNGIYTDYIGGSVDTSERLSDGANAGAIFVDESTRNASNMMNVFSHYGNAVSREGGQYLAQVEELPTGWDAERIRYYEILWAAQSFGVRTSTVTEISVQNNSPAPSAEKRRSSQTPWQQGVLSRWNDDRDFGFVRDGDGESYYLHRDSTCVGTLPIRTGDTVFFVAEPSHQDGRSARATCALASGAELTVRVDKVFPAFGFSRVSDGKGVVQDLFLDLGYGAQDRYHIGQHVRIRLSHNAKGPVGVVLADEIDALSA